MANNIAKAAAAMAKRGRGKEKVTEEAGGKEYSGTVKGGYSPRKAWEMQKYRSEDGDKVKMKRTSDESGSYEIVKKKGKGGSYYSSSYKPNPEYGGTAGRTVIEKKKGQRAKITKYGSDK